MSGNKTRKTATWFLAVFLGVVWAAISGTASWADAGEHGRSSHPDPSRFAWHLLKAKETLALTDEQTARLQSIGLTTKKDAVKRAAEIELAEIDLHQLLHGQDKQASGDELDRAVKKLYALKAERRLASIKAFGDLRAVLTPEQQKKMRELRGTRRACADGKGSDHSGMGGRRADAQSPADNDAPSGEQPLADAHM